MTNSAGVTRPGGELGLRVVRAEFDQLTALSRYPARELGVREIAYWGLPRPGLPIEVNAWRARNTRNLWRGARRALTARALGLSNVYGSLYLTHVKADGTVVELGLASMRVVTTAGMNYLVGTFAGSGATTNLKYHGIGTTNTAEAAADTALAAESTTALNPDNTRATGSTTTGGSANIYRTVGTLTADATIAAVEHGVFSQAATGGGTLLDRSVFSTVTLASGDSLQATYDLTFAAGG
jgi:hypothetical protein